MFKVLDSLTLWLTFILMLLQDAEEDGVRRKEEKLNQDGRRPRGSGVLSVHGASMDAGYQCTDTREIW